MRFSSQEISGLVSLGGLGVLTLVKREAGFAEGLTAHFAAFSMGQA